MKRPVRVSGERQRQLTREWRLLRELQRVPQGRSYRELAKTLQTGIRTVYRDLTTLRQAGFRIERAQVHTKAVWRLLDIGGPPLSFTPSELTSLAMARQMVLGLPGSPFARAARQAFAKIEAACDREGLKVLEAADRTLYADLRRARAYTDREIWFRMILDAMGRHRTVRIRYFTLERGREGDRLVDPYGLIWHEGAFYLVGRCHARKDVRTFLVDRIRAVNETPDTFSVPEGFSTREHFRQSWGLLRDRALEVVRIRFAPRLAKIIQEGRWHESQRLAESPDGGVIMSVRVAGWEEIKRWVLGFGADAEVLSPPALRRELAGIAQGLAGVYLTGPRRRRRARPRD